MAEFEVNIIKSWPEKISVVDQIAFEQYTNGEKLSGENIVMDVRAYAHLSVHNEAAQNQDYEVVAFKTDCGVYYTGSETVRELSDKIVQRVVEAQPGVKVITLRTASKDSTKHKNRSYLVVQLLDVSEDE